MTDPIVQMVLPFKVKIIRWFTDPVIWTFIASQVVSIVPIVLSSIGVLGLQPAQAFLLTVVLNVALNSAGIYIRNQSSSVTASAAQVAQAGVLVPAQPGPPPSPPRGSSVMWTAILNFLSGGIIGQIADPLLDAYKTKLQSNDQAAQLAAQDEIDSRRAALQLRLATAGYWEQRVIPVLITLPFILHVWLVALDTCFKFGWSIPKFPTPMDSWEATILLSYFGVVALSTTAKSVAGAIVFGKASN